LHSWGDSTFGWTKPAQHIKVWDSREVGETKTHRKNVRTWAANY